MPPSHNVPGHRASYPPPPPPNLNQGNSSGSSSRNLNYPNPAEVQASGLGSSPMPMPMPMPMTLNLPRQRTSNSNPLQTVEEWNWEAEKDCWREKRRRAQEQQKVHGHHGASGGESSRAVSVWSPDTTTQGRMEGGENEQDRDDIDEDIAHGNWAYNRHHPQNALGLHLDPNPISPLTPAHQPKTWEPTENPQYVPVKTSSEVDAEGQSNRNWKFWNHSSGGNGTHGHGHGPDNGNGQVTTITSGSHAGSGTSNAKRQMKKVKEWIKKQRDNLKAIISRTKSK